LMVCVGYLKKHFFIYNSNSNSRGKLAIKMLCNRFCWQPKERRVMDDDVVMAIQVSLPNNIMFPTFLRTFVVDMRAFCSLLCEKSSQSRDETPRLV
jgi:hypothetical protein